MQLPLNSIHPAGIDVASFRVGGELSHEIFWPIIDDTIVAVNAGYSGSSKDHYYPFMGAPEEVSRVSHRECTCGCKPCLKLLSGLTLTRENSALMAGTTPRAHTEAVHPACPAPASCYTQNARKRLSLGKNIIVQVCNEERADNPDEDYFVGKVEEKAMKVEEN